MKNKLPLILIMFSSLNANAFSLEQEYNKKESLIKFPMELLTEETSLNSIKADYIKTGNEKLAVEQVNYYFNQFNYQEDIDSKGSEDYWKTTEEFIAEDGGDCEDFALIKYYHLLDLGIKKEKFKFYSAYVVDTKAYHLVLGYSETPNSEPLFLDNMSKKLMEKSKRVDLVLISSFNDFGYSVEMKGHESNKSVQKTAQIYYNKYNALNKKEKGLRINYF